MAGSISFKEKKEHSLTGLYLDSVRKQEAIDRAGLYKMIRIKNKTAN
jgi:hypothetical protein